MKVVLISDIHLLSTNMNNRKDNIVESQWEKLHYVYKTAEKLGAIVVQAGDFVDSPRSWILMKLLIDFFARYPTVSTYFVAGQHDVYFRSSSLTIMSILPRVFSNVCLLTEKPLVLDDVILFGQSYMETSKTYKCVKGKFNILAVHKPISRRKLMYDTSNAKRFLRKHKDFECIICGDIHQKFRIVSERRCILNTSSLVRKTRLDSPPGFYVLDVDTNTYRFYKIPCEEDVFTTVNDKDSFGFLDEFVNKMQSNRKLFFDLTPKEKVLALIEKRKSYKSVKALAIEIMEEDSE